jgi:glycosyltransferase involved in cell wall biosynthesis
LKTPVLFVHTPLRPPLGADTWVHSQIARHLDRTSHDLHAACARGAGESASPTWRAFSGIPDLKLKQLDLGPELSGLRGAGRTAVARATLPALFGLVRLSAYVRRHRIRLVYTSDRPRDALASVLAARAGGARCLIHAHVAYGQWMGRSLRWALRHADALAAVSRFVAQSLVQSGHPAERTHVVLNGIEPEDWDFLLDGAPVRQELGLPAAAPVLLSASRLFPAKGHPELLRAVSLVRREVPDIRLVIAGSWYVDGYEATLRGLVRELGLEGVVLFIGHRPDMARLMAAADVYSMASFEEPFGLVFLEAMAMKRPVVALANGGTPEVVEHGEQGLLSEPGDIEGLAANLLALVRDPARRARMGDSGRRRVEACFTSARMARDTAEAFQRALA